MEFALQYELQRSRPHYPGFQYDIYHQATEQVKLADRLGYHSVWTVEHHFLSEWSYSSAPEVWYGALSQVTSRIRLGPFDHRAGTRRLPGESGRLARDVGGSSRGDSENVDAGDLQPRRQVLQ